MDFELSAFSGDFLRLVFLAVHIVSNVDIPRNFRCFQRSLIINFVAADIQAYLLS